MAPSNDHEEIEVKYGWYWRVPGYGGSLCHGPGRGWIPLQTGRRKGEMSWFLKTSMVTLREKRQRFWGVTLDDPIMLKVLACADLCTKYKDKCPNDRGALDTFFRPELEKAARETDLSTVCEFMVRLDDAVAKMHSDLCAMLFVMPCCAPFLYSTSTGACMQIRGLLKELNQQCRPQRSLGKEDLEDEAQIAVYHTVPLPLSIAEICQRKFFAGISEALTESIGVLFMDAVSSNGKKPAIYLDELLAIQQRDVDALMERIDMAAAKAKGDRERAAFLEKAGLEPPRVLRMIDCVATCQDKERVVLVGWNPFEQASRGITYSAISHTFGAPVYKIFDCSCATICRAGAKERARYAASFCPHASDAEKIEHYGVVKDIINMCGTLRDAGVGYAWHDGVCIAQYDEDEVRDTIEHIGWVYASARETIVFLHYVGKPMAPIRVSDSWNDVRNPMARIRVSDRLKWNEWTCRWHQRVWTLQETALSKSRRYCVRVGTNTMQECKSPEDVVDMVGRWYDDKFSKVEVVEEERFFEILTSLYRILLSVFSNIPKQSHYVQKWTMLIEWFMCVRILLLNLETVCFGFPTIDTALKVCKHRDSKHRGDRINSILTLAGVKGFVAEKDNNVEASTLEFFKRQGQEGLARALLSFNVLSLVRYRPPEYLRRQYKWLPVLDSFFYSKYINGWEKGISLTVLENGRLELRPHEEGRGELACIRVRIVHKPPLEGIVSEPTEHEQREICNEVVSRLTRDRKLEMNVRISDSRTPVFTLPAGDSSFSSILGRMSASSLQTLHVQVVHLVHPSSIEGHRRLLKEEESFDAYLVIVTSGSLSMDQQLMLLLHGNDIHCGEVLKIGIFEPCKLFSEVLDGRLSLVTEKLEKVVLI